MIKAKTKDKKKSKTKKVPFSYEIDRYYNYFITSLIQRIFSKHILKKEKAAYKIVMDTLYDYTGGRITEEVALERINDIHVKLFFSAKRSAPPAKVIKMQKNVT